MMIESVIFFHVNTKCGSKLESAAVMAALAGLWSSARGKKRARVPDHWLIMTMNGLLYHKIAGAASAFCPRGCIDPASCVRASRARALYGNPVAFATCCRSAARISLTLDAGVQPT